MDKAIRAFPEINGAKVGYGDAKSRIVFVSSEGAEIETETYSIMAKASFTARKGAVIESGRLRIGGTCGFEIFDLENPAEKCRKVAKSTIALLDAKSAPGGRFPVICDHELTGVFTHEAVGHCCESDIVLAGESVLAGKIGKKVAAPEITIVDDPTLPGAFGSFPYDDEGVKAQRKILIENGVLKSYILNRENAHKLKMEPNGGARAESFAERPIVRMSNTFIAGGKEGRKFDELLEGIKLGIYAKGTRGGQVDTVKGSFQFSAGESYLIENGKITRPLKGVSLSGMTLETLNNIDAIGNDFKLGDPGICGKGQMVPVCDGGPHIRIQNCVVGGMQ
ncbi:MAG: TldD/PmbA family protein, partial [Candidatus Thermoplasmatota archaeon]|nr:TldD/PmbA family protein [Candidatus Thermoplasmatota archaeon]